MTGMSLLACIAESMSIRMVIQELSGLAWGGFSFPVAGFVQGVFVFCTGPVVYISFRCRDGSVTRAGVAGLICPAAYRGMDSWVCQELSGGQFRSHFSQEFLGGRRDLDGLLVVSRGDGVPGGDSRRREVWALGVAVGRSGRGGRLCFHVSGCVRGTDVTPGHSSRWLLYKCPSVVA